MAAATTTSSALAAVLLCAAAFLAVRATDGNVDGAHRHHKHKGGDLVATACSNATSHSGQRLTKEFCESALRSDKRSAVAKHPRDLALIAIDLIQHGASAADAKVARMLRSGSVVKVHNKETAVRLRYCRLDYDAVARTVPECRAMVQGYKTGRGHRSGDLRPYVYLECVDRLSDAAVDCWLHIVDEVTKVVRKEVDEVVSRATLAKAMLDQMLGIVEI